MMAAFSKSLGMLRKNWRKKKMLNALEPVEHIRQEQRRICVDELHIHNDLIVGDEGDVAGDHHLAMNARNKMFLPRNSSRVSAYAVREATAIMQKGIATDKNTELTINLSKGSTWNRRL